MKKKMITLALLLSALVLEILPWGAVCNFANPEGEPWRQTFSYFSMIPFGYANFAPLITALLTCLLLLIVIIKITFKKELRKSSALLAGIASVISLCPLLFGLSYFSIVGAGISLCLIGATVFITLCRNNDPYPED